MKLAFFFAMMCTGSIFGQEAFTKAFPLQWKTKIGVTTYRTNMIFQDGSIFIGSNGLDRNFKNDSLDGVVRINAKTGKLMKRYATPLGGDNDITGIAVDGNSLYCGSDNYTFYCYDIKTGEEIWKYPVPYDVESAPVLADFNGDGKKDVFFSVERNGFYALNGIDGSVIWRNDSITSHNGNSGAIAYDVNEDGTLDVITSGDYHVAMDGRNGNFLWRFYADAGINSTPFLVKYEGEMCVSFIDTYGEYLLVTVKGDKLLNDQLDYNHFEMPVISQNGMLYLGSSAIDISSDHWIGLNFDGPADPSIDYSTELENLDEMISFFPNGKEETISATTMLADVLGNGKIQSIVVSEQGTLIIADENGKNVKRYKLPSGAEASVFIKDIDGDGKLEILIADLAGYLSCYSTNSKGKVELGSYK